MKDFLSIKKAREHNLKNISINLPRNKMIVFTGVSGSGKSSLAFDTIFKEGQRRYIASLSAYARQFIQNVDRPDVDRVDGLSPTICIDQKSVGRNPRSTVGTITEIYDYLRLLFSRLGTPHCPNGHGPIKNQTAEVIIKQLFREHLGKTLLIMAPMVVDRKGEYRKELDVFRDQGFVRILINGKLYRLDEEIILARYEKHTLEIILDRVTVENDNHTRISDSVYKAVELSGGKVSFLNYNHLNQDPKVKRTTYGENSYIITNIKNACEICGIGIKEMEPKIFSFNSPQDACQNCFGLGYTTTFAPELMVADENQPVFAGGLGVLNKQGNVLYTKRGYDAIKKIYQTHKVNIDTPWKDISPNIRMRILMGAPKLDEIKFSCVEQLTKMYDKYKIHHLTQFHRQHTCGICDGSGIGEIARYVTIAGNNINVYNRMQIRELYAFIEKIDFSEYPEAIWKPIAKEIGERLYFLINVGLEYLTLNRKANTLSGGEAQRIRLAAQVGSGLEGCLYVLDEPSIGLHSIDNQKLIGTLKDLQAQQNSLIVIEHDEETMLAADHIVEIGPGAGVHGGEITYNDEPRNIFLHAEKKSSSSIDYLIGKENIQLPKTIRPAKKILSIGPLKRFNLKNLQVEIPLESLVILTGVSGSGKSTLLDILNETIRHGMKVKSTLRSKDYFVAKKKPKTGKKALHQEKSIPDELDQVTVLGTKIVNLGKVERTIEINQKPIGRTPRSNPATYTDAWTHIRDLFAQTKEAHLRGYGKSRFSFNLKGGRCEECMGSGVNRIETQFLSSIEVVCEACDGKRFNQNTLSIHYKEKNIFDILEMTIEEASDFFAPIPKLNRILKFLNDIGLGYMTLGQNSTTLSGGEAQRIKLAAELSQNTIGKTLYLLDEPTTGLHFSDIAKLLDALASLVDNGNTVIVIEHNPEVIKCADHIIEMGPEGGDGGGKIVFSGVLTALAQSETATGKIMHNYLERQTQKLKGMFLKKANQKNFFPIATTSTASNTKKTKRNIVSIKSKNIADTKEVADLQNFIVIRGLKTHNLKNIDLTLPKNQIIVFTGVSGSGKTSIALDSIFTEGQRKYLESLSTYARRFLGRLERPPAELMDNLSPTIAIDRKNSKGNMRSTIATQTEIYDNLRNLFANVGTPHCNTCDIPMTKYSETMAAKELIRKIPKNSENEYRLILAPLYLPVIKEPNLLIQKKAELGEAINILREQGFLRLLINNKLIKLEEVNTTTQKQMQHAFLVIDRIAINEDEEERIIAAFEKAYQIGSNIALASPYIPDIPDHHTSAAKLNKLKNKSKSNLESEEIIPGAFWFSNYPACWQHYEGIKEKIIPRHFSFNHHLGACKNCNGIGKSTGFNLDKLIVQKNLPFQEGLAASIKNFLDKEARLQILEREIIELRKITPNFLSYDFNKPFHELNVLEAQYLLWGKSPLNYIVQGNNKSKKINTPKPWQGLYYELLSVEYQYQENFYPYFHDTSLDREIVSDKTTCPICRGARLQPYLANFKINRLDISGICNLSIEDAYKFFIALAATYKQTKQTKNLWLLSKETLEEITFRLSQMLKLGLDYLSLSRETGTLSGGELQRIRLSTQIGNQLRDVIYVLDEPTVGLHEHDNQKLITVVKSLRDLGNTVILVEHDGEIIRSADYIVDVGPAAGELGGKIMYAGKNVINKLKQTSFYEYLKKLEPNHNGKNQQPHSTSATSTKFFYPREKFSPFNKNSDTHLYFENLTGNNLHQVSLSLPLYKMTGISGVSGSGKSTLLESILDVLQHDLRLPSSVRSHRTSILKETKLKETKKTVPSKTDNFNPSVVGFTGAMDSTGKVKITPPTHIIDNPLTGIRVVDQSPVSVNRRSTLVSYMDMFDDIRKIFAQSRSAKSKGFKDSFFSYNSVKGQCPKCKGLGEEEIEMHFISNVNIICEECRGKRYKQEVLDIYFNSKNIFDVLDLTFQQAAEYFSSFTRIEKKITRMIEAGLGYLKLGFKTSVLSGGERQRLKIAHELAQDNPDQVLYLLDEPTTGLHFRDIEKLIKLLEKLVLAGGTVVTIEHNIEFLRSMDHLIDLGPGSGPRGGKVVATGNPRILSNKGAKKFSESITLKYL